MIKIYQFHFIIRLKVISSTKLKLENILPAERIMAERYNVTRVTARQAIKLLVEENYLETKHGSGTYISDRKPSVALNGNKIIGVLVPDIKRGIMIDLIRGIEDEAMAAGYNTILCNTDNLWDKANVYVNQLLANGIKGVIYVPVQDIGNLSKKEDKNREIIEKFIKGNTPIVLADHKCKRISTDLEVSDNFGGGFEMTEYLINMGHRRIAVVYDYDETSIEDRIAGHKEALLKRKIEFNPELVQKIKEFGLTKYFSDHIKMVINKLNATAIFAMNDLLAMDVYNHAKNLGYNIPNDISVVGYDDLQFADRMETPLTTIRQPLYQMGRESVKLFLERSQKIDDQLKKVILHNRLIIRKSVKRI